MLLVTGSDILWGQKITINFKRQNMEITYYGQSAFKIKGSVGTVVTDPFEDYIGLSLPSLSADMVTVSHQHPDHNAVSKVKGTARREKPFIVDEVGEYEVAGISVFGVKSYHDDHQGAERGGNIIFTIMIDDIRVCHLGDLGHELTNDQIAQIGDIDVLLVPVGGTFTIDPDLAVKTINTLEPAIAIPMHYKTANHDEKVFGDLKPLDAFLNAYGSEATPVVSLKLDKKRLPEETELVVLSIS